MQRRTAVAAEFMPKSLHAQPVTPRRAIWIQTLHGPSGQVLHRSPVEIRAKSARTTPKSPCASRTSREDARIVREAPLCVNKNPYY